jgi:endoglucanase
MNRREFLQTVGALALTATAAPILPLSAAEMPAVSAKRLPRWRGFNLLAKFVKRQSGNPPFQESDYAMLAEWKFNFVRLPISKMLTRQSSSAASTASM